MAAAVCSVRAMAMSRAGYIFVWSTKDACVTPVRLPVACLSVLLLVLGVACAHATPSNQAQFDAGLQSARQSARQDARIVRLEALVGALEARLQAVQAQSRAQGELARPGPQLTYERWQPKALERLTDATQRSIVGTGQDVRLSSSDAGRTAP